MPELPIVWHLDTDDIRDKTGSPTDRLTRIKKIMECYELENAPLRKTTDAIKKVCDDKFTHDDLLEFLQKYGCTYTFNPEDSDESSQS